MRYSFILLAALVFFPGVTSANKQNKRATGPVKVCLTDRALDGSVASLTFSWPCVTGTDKRDASGYDMAHLYVHYTFANAGSLVFTCTNSDDSGTTQNTPQACPSGTCTGSGVFTTEAFAADADVTIEMKIAGHREGQCVVSHSGVPDGNDKVQVNWRHFASGGS